MNVLNRLKLWQKLTLLVLVFAIPTALLGAFYFSREAANVASARDALDGAEYTQALGAMLAEMQTHSSRTREAGLAPSPASQAALAASDKKLLKIVADVDAIDAKFGKRFSAAEQWQAIKSLWVDLQTNRARLELLDNIARHDVLLIAIVKQVERVALWSGLSREPEVSTAMAIRVAVEDVPRSMLVFRQVRVDGINAVQQGALSDRLRTALEMHEREFEGHIQRTREGVDETTDETSATIQPALEKAEGAFAKFDSFIRARILNAEKIELTPKQFYDVARPATASLSDLSAAAYLAATNALNKRLVAAAARRNITAGIVAVALVTALALTWLVTRSMTGPMGQAIAVFRAISAGMYNNRIEHKGTDEASEVLQALDDLQQQLLTQGGKSELGDLRIKSALDKASPRLMLTDESLKIIYVNDSAQRFLHEARGDLQRDFPQLDVGNIIGQSADTFFGNRLAQRRGHDQTLSYETDLRVGARAMKATSQAIVDRDGKRIGIAVELLDQLAADAPFKSGRVA